MSGDLAFYAHLVLFLSGSLVYGFLTRELFRQPQVLPGWPARLLALALTLWFGGCLLDEALAALVAEPLPMVWLPVAADSLRGLAWLLSFPLLCHTLWHLPVFRQPPARSPHWLWAALPYGSLALFVPSVVDRLQSTRGASLPVAGPPPLLDVAWHLFPQILAHTGLACAIAIILAIRAHRRTREPDLLRLLQWLIAAVTSTFLLLVTAFALRSLAEAAPEGLVTTLFRLLSEASSLLPGLVFLYFVLRYNLLQLSLSHRSLRHFLSVIGIVLLTMIVVQSVDNAPSYRPFVATASLLALLLATFYGSLKRLLESRYPELRRWLGSGIASSQIEALAQHIQTLDGSETALYDLTTLELGRWLRAPVSFWTRGSDEGADLWSHFGASDGPGFNRLTAPTAALRSALLKAELQAVFPLRLGGELAGLFVVGAGRQGGGYGDGEMEAVTVALRQLATTIELRRLLGERLEQERRLSDQERLSLLGMVSASLAHEIKNPLSAIRSLAQTVGQELQASDRGAEQAEDLALIVEQIDRLDALSHRMLDFARSPTDPGREGVDLAELLRRSLWILDHQAKQRGLTLEPTIDPVGRVPGSAATWQTIVVNLLVNAIEHAPTGSTIRVDLQARSPGVSFATENGGEPIAESIAARLFEPFVGDTGSGLGLALARQRAEDLGGTIGLSNERDRIRFEVTVPTPPSSTNRNGAATSD